MNAAVRSIRAGLAAVAFLACIGATPGPRGTLPTIDYEDMPRPNRQQRTSGQPGMSQDELVRQEGDLAVDVADLDAWMRRIHGRFRVEGEVEAIVPSQVAGVFVTRKGKISGVADCAGVGEGPGVQCIFNATWPVIDAYSGPPNVILPRSPSEALRTFNPALLVLGFDPKLLEVRAMLVTSDTMTHTWAGLLNGNNLVARRKTGCPRDTRDTRCIALLHVTAEPDSEQVTLKFRAGATIGLAMQRDPEARPEKPMKTLKKVR